MFKTNAISISTCSSDGSYELETSTTNSTKISLKNSILRKRRINRFSGYELKANVCNKCGKSYKRVTDLYRHKNYECDNPKMFHCTLCPHKTSRKYSLQDHIRRMHYQN